MADTQIPLWYSNPSGKNREKDVYMSEKSRAEENQVQTLYCNLVSGDVTWVKTSSFAFGKKAQILSKTGKKKMKMDFYSLWFTYKLDSISFENRRPWSVRNMYARHLLCRKWAENCILSCSCLPSLQTNFKYSTEDTFDKIYYHSMQTFLPFHWPKAHHVTCK